MALQEITNYLEDDWDDNALSSRSNNDEGYFLHPSDGLIADLEAGDALNGAYRPEWKEINSGYSLSNSRLEATNLSGGLAEVITPTEFRTGRWKTDYQFITLGGSNGSILAYLMEDNYSGNPDNGWRMSAQATSNENYRLSKFDAGTSTHVIDGTWSSDTSTHTISAERTVYGDWELFLDGASQGTATDTYLPDVPYLGLAVNDGGGGTEAAFDNLVVQ